MRGVLIGLAAAVCALLGIVQLTSMAVYGDLAHPPAVPALLPPRLGLALARRLGGAYAPPGLRTAYAQALLHRGDTAAAAAIVATLPDGIAAAELRGQLAQARNDPDAALADYARAGDFERAQGLIDERLASGRVADAARFERELTAALTGGGQAAVRARALWRLGQITQFQAAADPDAQRQARLERSALVSYEQALAIAPNEETYLLAAAQQALTLGDKPLAIRYYTRALDAVPASADARAGLERARS
jgi:tetratricopeptide (TPR) repeat protein